MGPYDNDACIYLESPWLQQGHWYQGDDGSLYIVPTTAHGLAEIEGPDGEVLDALNAAYRTTDFDKVDQEAVAKRLDIDVIPEVLKRFSEEIGYFSA